MREPLIRYPIVQHAYVVEDLDESIRHWIEVLGAGPFFVSRNHVGRELTYRGAPSQTLVHYAFGQSGNTQVPDRRSTVTCTRRARRASIT
jgi:hypothetical protein